MKRRENKNDILLAKDTYVSEKHSFAYRSIDLHLGNFPSPAGDEIP